MRQGSLLWVWLLACLAIGLCGCPRRRHDIVAPPCYSCYRTPDLEHMGIRRVVLLPTEYQPSQAEAAERFRAALASELRSTGLFEVVSPPLTEFGCWDASALAYGWAPVPVLRELSVRYSADGVVFSSLRDYHPYSPPRIAATVHLVATRQAATLVSVDGVWDASNESVSRSAQEYSDVLSPADRMDRADIVLHTPAYYEKFVASQIAHAFASQWPPYEAEVISFSPPTVHAGFADTPIR